ncbi:MAG: hypothetical protein ACRENP_28690, partial [Longimicrobiales bacterium]
VWRALLPLAIGHALAIAGAVLIAGIIGLALPVAVLKWIVAAVLFSVGIYRFFRHRHPRYGGMRVNRRDLTVWSMLMASAHGAGLMVLPVVLDAVARTACCQGHASHGDVLMAGAQAAPMLSVVAASVHTIGYLIVTGTIAAIVYHKLGLRLLRTMWFNLDVVWSAALIITALLTPLL